MAVALTDRRGPGLPALTAVALAAGVGAVSAAVAPQMDTHSDAGAMAGMTLAPSGLVLWVLMVAAMMLPGALPVLRQVAATGRRSVALFLMAYSGLWIAAGAALLAVAAFAAPRTGAALAGALIVAAGWQLTGAKHRAVGNCHHYPPATCGATQFGLRYGGACVRSCWALMLVMAVASSWSLAWMAALTVAVAVEKRVPRPRRATRSLAVALGAAGLVAAAGGGTGAPPAAGHGAAFGSATGRAHRTTLLCRIPKPHANQAPRPAP